MYINDSRDKRKRVTQLRIELAQKMIQEIKTLNYNKIIAS